MKAEDAANLIGLPYESGAIGLPYESGAIGLPYESGAIGPDSFNCWGLLIYVQRLYFGVQMPEAPIGDREACLGLAESMISSKIWVKVDQPSHGDGALLRGGLDPHVGIYLDLDGGGILHALEGEGVVFTHLSALNHCGFGRTSYYRLKNDY